jgi:hypothetical protein
VLHAWQGYTASGLRTTDVASVQLGCYVLRARHAAAIGIEDIVHAAQVGC